MPMKLGFVKNAVQRIAAHKRIPSQHLEAVLVYGTPPQRVKALQQIVEASPELSLHKETHQMVLSLCSVSDKTLRCELLYALRGKLRDLARNRFGNVVLQKLIEGLPTIQRNEIAESLKDEMVELAAHPFGNHVLQALTAFEGPRETLLRCVKEDHRTLMVHPIAQHVIASLVAQGCTDVVSSVVEIASLQQLIALKESAVLTELCKGTRIDESLSAMVREIVRAAVPDLLTRMEQHFALVAAVDASTIDEISKWQEVVMACPADQLFVKGNAEVVAALITKSSGGVIKRITSALEKKFNDVLSAAQDPYASLVLRAIISTDVAAVPAHFVTQAHERARELIENPASAVVVHRLLQYPAFHRSLGEKIAAVAGDLLCHSAASHAIQHVLECCDRDVTVPLMSLIANSATKLAVDPHGTFVLQKCVVKGTPAIVEQVCDALATDIAYFSKDNKGCYAVAAALQAAKEHSLPQTKKLMDLLKPHVAALAVLPWSGRIVLEAMFVVASAPLKAAMQNVIFLKCEMFLSEPPARSESSGRRGRQGHQGGEKRNRTEQHE